MDWQEILGWTIIPEILRGPGAGAVEWKANGKPGEKIEGAC